MRSIVAPAFSLDNVRNMNDSIWSVASLLQTKLASHIIQNTEEKSRGVIVDLTHWSSVANLEVIGRCGFKYDFQFGEAEHAKSILHAMRAQASAGLLISTFIGLVVLRTFPFITSLPIPSIQAQGELKSTVRKLALHLINSDSSDNLHGNTDVLSLLCVYLLLFVVHKGNP